MEGEIVLKFEDIYTPIRTPNKNYKNHEDKMNRKLLSETNSQSDRNLFFDCLSSCCFFLICIM